MATTINSGTVGPDTRSGPFEIAGRKVYPRRNEIITDGQRQRIESRAMTLLLSLSRTPGETVSRSELLEEVWPGITVGDDSLTQAISKLRRALGDLSGPDRVIETVPKIGYRLTQAPRAIKLSSPASPMSSAAYTRRNLTWPNGQLAAGAFVALTLAIGLAFVAKPWTQAGSTAPEGFAPGAVLPPPGEGKMLIYKFELREPLAGAAATPVVAYN